MCTESEVPELLRLATYCEFFYFFFIFPNLHIYKGKAKKHYDTQQQQRRQQQIINTTDNKLPHQDIKDPQVNLPCNLKQYI